MLVLTRRTGEALIIDQDVRVVILSVDHRGVRLGIEAPAERRVVREELLVAVAEQNRRAADPVTPPDDSLRPIVITPGATGGAGQA